MVKGQGEVLVAIADPRRVADFRSGGFPRVGVRTSERAASFQLLRSQHLVTPLYNEMAAQILPHQQSYLDLLLASQILAFNGPYTLKSGRKSPYFFNAGLFNTGAKVAKLAECYAEAIVRSGLLGSKEEEQETVLFGPAYKVRAGSTLT